MEASFFLHPELKNKAGEPVLFFKLVKPPISGSSLPFTFEGPAEAAHIKFYAAAFKAFEKAQAEGVDVLAANVEAADVKVVNIEPAAIVQVGEK